MGTVGPGELLGAGRREGVTTNNRACRTSWPGSQLGAPRMRGAQIELIHEPDGRSGQHLHTTQFPP